MQRWVPAHLLPSLAHLPRKNQSVKPYLVHLPLQKKLCTA